MEQFIKSVKSLLDIGDRQVVFDPHPGSAQLFINYINLPAGIGSAGGRAEAENNRIMVTVLFPSKGDHYEKPVAEGTLRVKQSVCHPRHEACKFRGKTATPEKLAAYVASYLNNVAREVLPNFTHTKV